METIFDQIYTQYLEKQTHNLAFIIYFYIPIVSQKIQFESNFELVVRSIIHSIEITEQI